MIWLNSYQRCLSNNWYFQWENVWLGLAYGWKFWF